MEYLQHILILIGIYTIAATSLNLVAGYTGLISIAHGAFVGIGAYVTALLALKAGLPFWSNLPLAMLIAAGMALLASIPALRVHDDYFVLATFALQIIATSILTNWAGLTGGPMGLAGIPQPTFLGVALGQPWQILLMVWAAAALTFWVINRLVCSPYGRVLKAIREDEVLSQAFGKNVVWTKVSAFAIGAALAAVAGSLYAVYITFIDPNSFTIMESIFMLAIVIVGGAGNLWGPLAGATVLIAIPELLRFLGLPTSIAAHFRQIFYGVLLVAMMLWRPQGLLGEFVIKDR